MAALAHETVVFDVNDFKLWGLTLDLPSNASPTYGPVVDVPGISSVTIDPNLISAELRGDARVIAKKGKIDRFTVGFTYGKLNIDAYAAMVGGDVNDPSDNEATWDYIAGGALPYFAAGFQLSDVSTDEGIFDVHVLLYKCQITGGQLFNPGANKFSEPTGALDAFTPNANAEGSPPGFRAIRVRLLDTITPLALV